MALWELVVKPAMVTLAISRIVWRQDTIVVPQANPKIYANRNGGGLGILALISHAVTLLLL